MNGRSYIILSYSNIHCFRKSTTKIFLGKKYCLVYHCWYPMLWKNQMKLGKLMNLTIKQYISSYIKQKISD